MKWIMMTYWTTNLLTLCLLEKEAAHRTTLCQADVPIGLRRHLRLYHSMLVTRNSWTARCLTLDLIVGDGGTGLFVAVL